MKDATDLSLRGILLALRRRWWIVLLCTFLTGMSAAVVSKLQTEQFTAQAILLFRDPGFDQRLFGASVFQNLDPDRAAATNVGLVSLEAVAERTAKNEQFANLDAAEITSKVAVAAEGQADLVSVSATDPDPELAARLSNSFAENYIEFRRDADRAKISQARAYLEDALQRLETSNSENAGSEAESLQKQISQLRALEALQTGNAELVQKATVPGSPSSPKTARNTIFGVLLGLIIGIVVALALERFDRRLRTVGEVEEIYGLPVLATTPESKDLSIGGSVPLEFSEKEAFRTLRTRLRYFNVDRDLRTVLITSAMPSEGKTTTAWHLARASAAAGRSTVLVEADLHAPVIARDANIAPQPGLAELLTHQNELSDVVQTVLVPESRGFKDSTEAERGLDVIVAGANAPNPLELLESHELANLFDRLREKYELVLVDTPPVNVISDAIPIIDRVDGVVVIARLGHTTRDAAKHLHQELERLDAPTLGVVANRVPQGRAGYGYGYGHYLSDQR